MAFPVTPLPVRQQLYINGAWVDIVDDTREAQGVVITRGYSGEQAQLSAGNAQFTVNNRNGVYSNDNPTSPNYRLLGRNTPYRSGVDTGVVSARFLDALAVGTNAYDGSVAWTADKAALDIVGDIDICVDIDPVDWTGRKGHILASKYLTTGNQRSWLFTSLANGYLQLIWSTDGTSANRVFATSPNPVNPTGRMQYRVQLDVNNGAGGWTCTFLQGDGTGITGTYTSIGSTSGAGVTSIFSSTARLEVGDANLAASWAGTIGGSDPFVGRFYGMLLRSGIAGTGVAAFRADSQVAGATTWVDSVSNTWTVTGSTYLDSIDFRFYGEVPSLPNRWDLTGSDVYIPVTANDIVARLTSGNNAKPLESPVKRNLKQFPWDGYWTMEQASDSTAVSAYAGKTGFKSGASFSQSPTGFPGTAGSLVFSDDTGQAYGNVKTSSGTPVTETYLCYFKFDTLPVSASPLPFIFFYPIGGTATRIAFCYTTTSYQLIILDGTGASLVTSIPGGFGTGMTPGEWNAMRIKLSASGGTVTWEWAWYNVNGATPTGLSGTYSGTIGRPLGWRSDPFTGKSGLELAHVAMGGFDFDFTSADFINSTNAFNGEQWDVRARRLAGEQNMQVYLEGIQDVNNLSPFIKKMGPQPLKPIVDLLQECAVAAGGILYCPRDKSGLTIRSLEQMVNQAGPVLDYSARHLSGNLLPEPDLFLIENDVTLTIPSGDSYRFVKVTGTLNANDPGSDADAVGTYDVGDTINLFDFGDLPGFTQRRVTFGTWDETRYPQVQVQLEGAPFVASPTLTAAVRKCDLGRAFSITHLPAWQPPNAASLMISGYVETLGNFTDTINWNTRPNGPWQVGEWGSTAVPTTSLWGARRTVLKTGVNSTATSLVFETTDKQEIWSTTAVGYQVEIAGERMTITAMGARSGSGPYDQTATVTRSVNGVVKSLPANSPITVVAQGRWA